MPRTPLRASAPENSAAAIERLTEQGYEATTAGDLADAVGMSRSTFFRRFGNKDDVIFADHDHALAQLEAFLDATTLSPADALVEGTADVLRLLTRNPEAARSRFELMHLTPSLRDRELVITHRYERVFAKYLRAQLPADTRDWVSTSLAAGLVAVHNSTLRAWLKSSIQDPVHTLSTELRQLVAAYHRWLSPEASGEPHRVVVAVYDAQGTPEAVLESISRALP